MTERKQLHYPADFYKDLHIKYVLKLSASNSEPTFESSITEHIRISGIYWGCMTLALVNALHTLRGDDIIKYVESCRNADGGYGGNTMHDSHLLYTLSALQIHALFNTLHTIDNEQTTQYIMSLYDAQAGTFKGDKYGEVDTRFSYCGLLSLTLLNKLQLIDKQRCTEFLNRCKNYDGGYGAVPGGESHSGQIWTSVASLALLNAVNSDNVDTAILGWWLAERQLSDSGGFNGRPEKKPDVCYSWWVLASLTIIQHTDWIDRDKLIQFILQCQDSDTGGISDRPGNMADIFHTYFGIAGLSLLGCDSVAQIDPVYALPVDTVKQLKERYKT